jgi:hypothetical protein
MTQRLAQHAVAIVLIEIWIVAAADEDLFGRFGAWATQRRDKRLAAAHN